MKHDVEDIQITFKAINVVLIVFLKALHFQCTNKRHFDRLVSHNVQLFIKYCLQL